MIQPLIDATNDPPAKTITSADLYHWHESLESRHLSPHTIRSHLRACRILFRWLHDEGHIDSNPAARLRLPRPPDCPPKAISETDIQRLIDTATSARDRAIILFLADSACRAGALCSLRLADLDLEHHRATVTEKGNRTRRVYFGKRTATALTAYLEDRENDEEQLFTGQRGALTTSGIYQILKRLAARAGVKRFNPHAFRHGWARAALRRGADLATVADVLGHSNVTTTHTFYARWNDEELQERHARYSWVNSHDDE
jgi:integrase/recombinase XerD